MPSIVDKIVNTHPFTRRLTISALLCLSLVSCTAPRFQKSANAKLYELRGRVVSVNKAERQVMIAHEEVPGFMGAMTMPFTLADEWAFRDLTPGDNIQAVLVVDEDRSWLEQPVITRESATDDAGTGSAIKEPQPGDAVPQFSLINQDGKRIRLQQYQGQALLLTFIYTRCPLPEYCPLMTSNFAQINQTIQREPSLSAKTRLLSISIDPAYDTPQVLKSYAATHNRSSNKQGSNNWDFATGTSQEVQQVAGFFGLNYYAERDQIVHSLRTALIGPDGRVYKIYRSNDWKPDQAMHDLRELLSKT